ncbi:MAG: hypothetical protein LM588_00375 [Fervidicoccaceae archaeon]|nr:hypothetical protein [Fervidicoccaceae archaeon]
MNEEILLIIVLILLAYFIARSFMIEEKIRLLRENIVNMHRSEEKEKIQIRKRKRYVVFHVISNQPLIRVEEINSILSNALRSCGGELLIGECRPQVVYFSSRRSRGILRTYHDCYEKVIACLSTVRCQGDRKILIIPVKTTGTLKKARWYLFDKNLAR